MWEIESRPGEGRENRPLGLGDSQRKERERVSIVERGRNQVGGKREGIAEEEDEGEREG